MRLLVSESCVSAFWVLVAIAAVVGAACRSRALLGLALVLSVVVVGVQRCGAEKAEEVQPDTPAPASPAPATPPTTKISTLAQSAPPPPTITPPSASFRGVQSQDEDIARAMQQRTQNTRESNLLARVGEISMAKAGLADIALRDPYLRRVKKDDA